MNYFNEIKKIINIPISDELLTLIILEMGRFLDKEYIKEIRKIQKENKIILDTPTRKTLRKKYYYGKYCKLNTIINIDSIDYNTIELNSIFKDCYNRLKTYNTNKIIQSIKRRIEDLNNNTKINENLKVWLKNYNIRRKDKKYSFVAINLNQEIYKSSNYDENIIINFIAKTYKDLENYRHLAIIIQGEIFNKNNECITWNLLYKAGIYAENFVQFNKNFSPFKKEKQINNLNLFLKERNIENSLELANEFYQNISTGYKFEDCYISNNQNCKILIFKKIELDTSNIPCPSCNTIIQNSNSYPEMFLQSWECKNPSCPDRSKSGRGKRFDEYGIYRYFKLVENKKANIIDNNLYQQFRKDIFDNKNDWIKFLIKEYTYSNEKFFIQNLIIKNTYNRISVNFNIENLQKQNNIILEYENLPIVKLFKKIINKLILKNGNEILKENIEIINNNSSIYLQKIKQNQIGTVITSPPYYNAREYSQWNTIIMYLVDMMINCKSIYNILCNNSYYLYNIGDIVSEDNIYVMSNMSKHRIQLGFLSCMIFELSGYNLTGNIIWDKGEVQSKRNSTINMMPGYVKCVNCYEHVFVFRKGKYEKLSNFVKRITPVIKINNKGVNTYKHTAPYPIEIVDLIRPYIKENYYILDPFLGSGTTLKWCKINNYKGIGIELNKEYYELCKKNIFNNENSGEN